MPRTQVQHAESVVREYHIMQTDEVCRVGTAPCYPKDAARVVVIYVRVI